MESHQLELLPNSLLVPGSVKSNPDFLYQNSDNLSVESGVHRKGTVVGKQDLSIGVLEVYIHQARDISNVCIYHKQDVYAKIFLTSDPETTASTQAIYGGGMNPIFNENLPLNVHSIDSSLKCEIWMLSRIRNYLEDQLLGFVSVPLCDVVMGNGKLAQEFSLSSCDLIHSPAGFVQLTLTYTGASPEVSEIPTKPSSVTMNLAEKHSDVPISHPCALEKIEFPDPKIVNENEMMVSEYFRIQCGILDSQSVKSLGTTSSGKHLSSEDNSGQIVEGISYNGLDGVKASKIQNPQSSVSTENSRSDSSTPEVLGPLNHDDDSSKKEIIEDTGEAESGSSEFPGSKLAQPAFSLNFEPKQMVVQQEIVDMYMKSMQQFTESLAKMKLPLHIENEPADLDDRGSSEKVPASKSTAQGQRVFYGSRAFF